MKCNAFIFIARSTFITFLCCVCVLKISFSVSVCVSGPAAFIAFALILNVDCELECSTQSTDDVVCISINPIDGVSYYISHWRWQRNTTEMWYLCLTQNANSRRTALTQYQWSEAMKEMLGILELEKSLIAFNGFSLKESRFAGKQERSTWPALSIQNFPTKFELLGIRYTYSVPLPHRLDYCCGIAITNSTETYYYFAGNDNVQLQWPHPCSSRRRQT